MHKKVLQILTRQRVTGGRCAGTQRREVIERERREGVSEEEREGERERESCTLTL